MSDSQNAAIRNDSCTEVDNGGVAENPDSTLLYADLHRLLEQANTYSQKLHYFKADSVFRTILTQVNDIASDSISDYYMTAIVTAYTEQMPDSFSVPEEIAFLVYHRQMFRSLDSLRVSSNDSGILARLVTRSGVMYDVPMVWNDRVEKSLFHFISANRLTVEYWKKQAGNYLSFMKKMFADSLLPQDLAYLPLIESGFNPKAYSRSHASGIWQFIPSTGRLYGLRSSYWLDERRDPIRSTAAAIRYLKKLYGDFGDWHCALAAYNCGEGCVSRTIERHNTSDYWQLRLPAETMNYVPLYLAALTIAKDPEFAAAVAADFDTIPFDTVSISDCIDLRDIASGTGVPFDSLKLLNPHLLHWCTPPDMSEVLLYLPKGKAEVFKQFYASLPDEKKVRWYRYMVQSGDNLISIARRFKIPVEGIKSVNKLKGNRIVAGHRLFIPIPVGNGKPLPPDEEIRFSKRPPEKQVIPSGSSKVIYKVKKGDTVWKLAELFAVRPEALCGWNDIFGSSICVGQQLTIYTKEKSAVSADVPVKSGAAGKKGGMRYIVSKGDNLFRIAQNFSVSVSEIMAENGIAQGSLLHIGDTIYIPVMAPYAVKSPVIHPYDVDTTIYYTVKSGDNLWRIANALGIPVEQLYEFNGLQANSVLMPGDRLRIQKREDL